jgi:hypothetical protein
MRPEAVKAGGSLDLDGSRAHCAMSSLPDPRQCCPVFSLLIMRVGYVEKANTQLLPLGRLSPPFAFFFIRCQISMPSTGKARFSETPDAAGLDGR